MKKYLKRLNWFGSSIVFIVCGAGSIANENVTSILEWSILMLLFGVPFSLFFLFAGMQPK